MTKHFKCIEMDARRWGHTAWVLISRKRGYFHNLKPHLASMLMLLVGLWRRESGRKPTKGTIPTGGLGGQQNLREDGPRGVRGELVGICLLIWGARGQARGRPRCCDLILCPCPTKAVVTGAARTGLKWGRSKRPGALGRGRRQEFALAKGCGRRYTALQERCVSAAEGLAFKRC